MWTENMKRITRNMVYKYAAKLKNDGFPIYTISDVKFSRGVKTYGTCTRNRRNKTAVIAISEICFHSTADCLKNTILHELCHAMENTKGHDKQWYEYAHRVNSIYNTRITQYVSEEESKTARPFIEDKFKYKVTCNCCGKTWKYMRKSKIVSKSYLYKCSCGGKLNVEVM